jgi:hypothetical protein
MRLFTAVVIPLALFLTASGANAQGAPSQDTGRPGYAGASDFSGPYGAVPSEAPESAHGPGPAYGPGPYGPPPPYGPALLPPREVYVVLRENGFRPLGPVGQRGTLYVIAVTNRYGEDGRLVIDARTGQIVRFVPAYRMSYNLYGAAPMAYPPPGRSPTGEIDPPRPPALVPKMASRTPGVPIPKAAPPRPGEDKPMAERPAQQSAAVQVKPAETPQASREAPAPAAEVKPAAPQIQPTQPMPQVQVLE